VCLPVFLLDVPYLLPDVLFQNPVEVTPSDQPPEGLGLIGLGPSSRSQIVATLQGSTGDTPLDNIFRPDMSIPNLITVLLNLQNDTAQQYTDEFIISKILPEFQNISSQYFSLASPATGISRCSWTPMGSLTQAGMR
jgi:hypothetical protein